MLTTTYIRNLTLLAALLFLLSAPVHASFVTGTINNGAQGGVCGSVNPIDPGEPCAGSPNVSSVSLQAQFSDAGGTYDARLVTGYGLNKVYVASTAVNSGVSAASEWMVVYTLTGAPIGTPVELSVEIGYHVSLSSAGTNSAAGLRMVLNGDFFGPFDISTTNHPFGADNCFDRPGQTALGACAGTHQGSVSRTINAQVGPNNRLALLVSASVFGSGLTDAYNTAEILKVTVPDGIGWEYQGVSGNPLSFQNATSTSPVPEPGALPLFTAASLLVAIRTGWRRNHRRS